jgi:hypothetical protein
MGIININTVEDLRAAVKHCKSVYVWVNWGRDEGGHMKMSKAQFLRETGMDIPNDGAHGGPLGTTPVRAYVSGDSLFVG